MLQVTRKILHVLSELGAELSFLTFSYAFLNVRIYMYMSHDLDISELSSLPNKYERYLKHLCERNHVILACEI